MYPRTRGAAPFPWLPFLRASSLHVGAAAAAVSLRRDLTNDGSVSELAFDEAYAVSRLTPGTNLLALYVLLGRHVAGWRGAVQALTVAALIPSFIACGATMAYGLYAAHPLMAAAMRGARAGALAVLLWAAVRLIRPQLARHPRRGVLLGLGALGIALGSHVPPLMLLLLGAGAGATVLREAR